MFMVSLDERDVAKFRLNKVTLSLLLCCFIEYYDFMIYGIMSSVINKVFFIDSALSSSYGSYAASLVGLLIFASAFFARPVGAALFGYIGDKKGRRVSLNISLMLLMGSVMGIPLLPSPGTLGVFSVLMLAILRIMQGLAFGAEVGGLVLMAENVSRLGFPTVWVIRTNFCVAGMMLGVFMAGMCERMLTQEQMYSWGWRIPFLVAVFVSVPLPYLRKLIHESAEFVRYKASGHSEKIAKSLFRNICSVLFLALVTGLGAGFFYITVVYLDVGHKAGLLEYELSLVLHMLAISTGMLVKDNVLRKRCFVFILLAMIVLVYPTVHYICEGHMWARVLVLVLSGVYFGWYGPFVMFLFPVGSRQTSFSTGYNGGCMLAGLAPAICLWFFHSTGKDIMPWLFLAVIASVLVVIFTFFVRVDEKGEYKLGL
ncbi:MAG: MFS transporter [Aaplasma endosymbiont of Hyalomma asiaticum]